MFGGNHVAGGFFQRLDTGAEVFHFYGLETHVHDGLGGGHAGGGGGGFISRDGAEGQDGLGREPLQLSHGLAHRFAPGVAVSIEELGLFQVPPQRFGRDARGLRGGFAVGRVDSARSALSCDGDSSSIAGDSCSVASGDSAISGDIRISLQGSAGTSEREFVQDRS